MERETFSYEKYKFSRARLRWFAKIYEFYLTHNSRVYNGNLCLFIIPSFVLPMMNEYALLADRAMS